MKKKRGPYTVTASKAIYKNPWISVREDKVLHPDGRKGLFGVVTFQQGVTVVALDAKGNVYLTKEYHYGAGEVTLEAVSGGIEKGETSLQAAKRELKEETGFTARKWTLLGTERPLTTMVVAQNTLYLAENLTKGHQNTEDAKRIEIVKMPFAKVLKLIMTNKITSSESLAALLKAHVLINTRK